MRNAVVILGPLTLLTACKAGYGPRQDHSEFNGARLADDRRTVVFSYHRFAYRPAADWRAFPDGGIPLYEEDINLLGTYDLQTKSMKVLRREPNRDWQPGSGLFTIQEIRGDKALIAQGGQLRGPFKLGLKHFLLDLKSGAAVDLDLKADLARLGRELGQIHLVAPDGTLVFVTLSLDEAKDADARRNRDLVPEIWVRTPGGDYLKAAVSSHYQCVSNGEVFYWEPSTREFMAFAIATRATRKAPEFKVPEYQDVTEGVSLSADRQNLEYGVKANDQWQYRPLALTTATL